MIKGDKEGPTEHIIPAIKKLYCDDCKYFGREPLKFGHNYIESNYTCSNPDVQGNDLKYPTRIRTIAFMVREKPETPEWCPYLKKENV